MKRHLLALVLCISCALSMQAQVPRDLRVKPDGTFYGGPVDIDAGQLTIAGVPLGAGGGLAWGAITGTLSAQTDLQAAFDAKLDDSQATAFGLSLLDDANAAAARTTLGVIPSTADKIIHLSTAGNDSNDGLTPSTAKLTINAAVSALSTGGTLFAGGGTFTASAAITLSGNISIYGAGEGATNIVAASGANLFNITSSISFVTIADVQLSAGASGGDLIAFSGSGAMSQSTIRNVRFTQANTLKHAIYDADVGTFVEVEITGCRFEGIAAGHSVPLIHLITSNNSISQNSITNNRFDFCGNYCIQIENSYTYASGGNIIRNNVFEVSNGGHIKLVSSSFNLLENNWSYDMGAGPTTQHLIYIGKDATGGAVSMGNRIVNSGRVGSGTLGSGLKDIHLQSTGATDTLIDNVRNISLTDYAIDAGSNQARLVNITPGTVTLTNGDNVSTDYRMFDNASTRKLSIDANARAVYDSAGTAAIEWVDGVSFFGGAGSIDFEGNLLVGSVQVPGAITSGIDAGGLFGPGVDISTLNASSLTTGTVPDARIAATVTRDAEWDTAAEINTATTDDDFVTLTGAQTVSGAKDYTGANTGVQIVRSVAGVSMLGATGGTTIFTVPAGKTFVCTSATFVLTSVAGTRTTDAVWNIRNTNGGGALNMTANTTNSQFLDVAGRYTTSLPATNGIYSAATAGANVQFHLSTAATGFTTQTGTVYVTGFLY